MYLYYVYLRFIVENRIDFILNISIYFVFDILLYLIYCNLRHNITRSDLKGTDIL